MIVRAVLAACCLLIVTAAQAQLGTPPPTPVPMPPGMQLPPLRAAPPPAPTPPPTGGPAVPRPDWLARQTADLQALDKVDDKTAALAVPVNQTGSFGHLTIAVRACLVRPPDQPADAAAYLDIVDPRPNAAGFHGWMLADEPAASMFQHPVYDVRVTGCH